MSRVTNVVIHYATLEEFELAERIAAWFAERHIDIRSLTDRDAFKHWGGEKNPECNLLAGAYNYLELEEMLAFLAELPWAYPQAAQIWVKEQGDWRFQLWMHDGTRFTRVVDGFTDGPDDP